LEKQILLTFDLEEFDLPLEFGCPISEEEQLSISTEGLYRLTTLLSQHNIPATFFTTSYYAGKNEELLKNLSENHEIASHSKYHSTFRATDPPDSKAELEKITGKNIQGFRMPFFRKTDLSVLKAAGYRYDSSINPTLIPGRYNNLTAHRKVYQDTMTSLVEIPVSVSPLIRFPLSWLSFKNIPLPVFLFMSRMAMRKDSYLHLYFHPWEFADLDSFKIPWYVKARSGDSLSDRLGKLITDLKKTATFITISGFLDASGF
jgi:hypothetical protein